MLPHCLGASSTSPTPLATTLQSSDTGGCLVSFTGPNEDIPVQTSGSTVLPPFSSGGPSQTVPCSKFLAYILHVANSQNDTLPNTAHAPSSTRTTSSVDSEQHANASPNSSQSSVTAEISRDASSAIARATLSPSTALPTTTWNSSLYECPSITASISVPVFTDHNLEGCYAGTGGSTVGGHCPTSKANEG